MIAEAIENNEINEELFDQIIESFLKQYPMNEQEKEFFSFGLVSGFICCFDGVKYLLSHKKEELTNV